MALVGGVVVGAVRMFVPHAKSTEAAHSAKVELPRYVPTAAEWASLTIEPVSELAFRAERITEGKIAVNEESSTPIFSPYAGRVTKLLVKPSDAVERGQPLFVIEATDTVQGLNDFIASLGALNTARSKLNLAQIVEKRANDLYAGKAVPLKDWQQSQADLTTAQNDLRSAETALEAAHNRLRILGRSEEQISAFQQTRQMSADTPIYSPISGTVIQRKVGPGQFINSGAIDPVFIVGDLSTVWLTAFVRESEAAGVAVGQDVSFSLLALPGRTFKARIDYVSAAIDPATRRLLVRATIDNKDGLFKPEMFANVTIYAGGDHPSVGVPKQALIYEGDRVRLWVTHDDKSIELRQIQTGLINGNLVEVRANLQPGEKVVTRGSLFIDRAASGS
ncbi:membrane fusion protein, cobalt-zinc-cadmium efflux system [Bradyrhizobium lablabi]|uniref:Membrane fusion protein, cobalt-zinc-cadmium efflux system n=3 Tax=Nitrobacteraceae TaxID=41294 RepID=A0ABY0PFC7_9BRAD|nr:membrane fusion protein, cobalt-zinc-cadmium efflux system [Bradyrhizobium ottawaense]SED69205.1 membrane fusion protein, cobalt-zinc-cadmium efflux system [Bradyrhizobium lablabi]SHL65880.1 membrane fusion protein, cobalt-zinc-cadmium efflux system [Bradyrhizobium lablabi]